VVLFDEPSEGLSVPVTKLLAGIISTLRDSGTGVVLVEQNLSFALSIADAVSVMRNGVLQDSQERSDNGWDIPALESAMGIRRLEAVASITSSTDTGQRMESDGGNRG
jgi:branched-chain amino acid transport system ATP-binding protein